LKTWEKHLSHLRKFLGIIRKSGFTSSLKKTIWAQPEVKFLANIIGSGQRRVDPEQVERIKNLKIPQPKKQVRQIIGLF
jgi:hypothetical protein